MIPLPERLGTLIERPGASSLSLLRDRGATYRVNDDGKRDVEPDFLAKFTDRFNGSGTAEYAQFTKRRLEAMDGRARRLTLKTQSRLVIGLGLPQSGKENTAILLDRLTGAPYIPGSSVKGLARRAAREVAAGDLEGDRQFWSAHMERLFGSQEAEGRLVFYDAFPKTWPKLELDVLTPHYREYYETPGKVPGDWEDPVPVQFLAVQRGAQFDFFFRALDVKPREEDEEQTSALLQTALDWIGAGGKRSSGYGSFDPGKAAAQRGANTETWEGARVEWIKNKGKLKITGRKVIEAKAEGLISDADKERVKASGFLMADVEVRDGFEAIRVTFR